MTQQNRQWLLASRPVGMVKGCRVIGIAGGAEQCARLTDKANFDATIDYKNEDVDARLEELCPDGPANDDNVVQKRARLEGFVILDFLPSAAGAVEDLANGVSEGHITWEADVQSGFENAPKTLLRLYDGANLGKQLLEI
ncbi:MAG: hypothetical protein NZ808_03550 [Myxococcota bacterium]|nr:hypothetical protein [Myxococcota bacterium]